MYSWISLLAVVMAATGLTGCGSTLRISRAKTPAAPDNNAKLSRLPGVPFYVKTAGCKHETVWLQPVYTLALAVDVTYKTPAETAQPASSGTPTNSPQKGATQPTEKLKTNESKSHYLYTKVLSHSEFTKENVKNFRQLIAGSSPPDSSKDPTAQLDRVNKILDTWNTIKPGTYDPFEKSDAAIVASGDAIMTSNTVAVTTYVDYGTTYYLNSKRPLAGSSQANVKLSDEGTLSEGSAQVESKTLQTFLDLVPFKDVLTKVATAALPQFLEGHAPLVPPETIEATYEFDLKIDTKTYKRTHSVMMKASLVQTEAPQHGSNTKGTAPQLAYMTPPCPMTTNAVTSPSYEAYNSTIEEISSGEEKPDDSSVKVSGTIKLPKSSSPKGTNAPQK